ncbi:MAG: type II toxin-antitoxin system RelE/ParE family toxin [Cyclobacteriaceae bacterium]|jgi:plasmid stabilization system protein ParE|nr:type II toxin-antitoxin system RelE/ParE family toxin [Flammeovirgaceae bacterium]
MKIVWTAEAEDDYFENIEFLMSNWSEAVTREFLDDVARCLDLILRFPDMFPQSDYKGVRKAVIRRQISLFYLVDGDQLILLRFWNNYRDPQDIKF